MSNILEDIIKPGRIITIWGKSGSGKTILVSDLIRSYLNTKKIIVFTDAMDDIMPILHGLVKDEGKNIENLKLANVQSFGLQSELMRSVPQFIWSKKIEEHEEQNRPKFAEKYATIAHLSHYRNPDLLVFDEFTRLYSKKIISANDPSVLIKDLAFQLGILKFIAANNQVTVVLTSSTRSESEENEATNEIFFKDVPVAHGLISHYTDIFIHIDWTKQLDERSISVTYNSTDEAIAKSINTRINLKSMLGGIEE